MDINKVFQNEMPQFVNKRNIILGNLITKSKFINNNNQDNELLQILYELQMTHEEYRVMKCNRPNCKCCSHINQTSSYYNSDRSISYDINDTFNCNSKDVIYLINCNRCNALYIGQTGRKLKERLNNHRSDIRTYKKTAIAYHFNNPKHTIENLKITPIFSIVHYTTEEKNNIELSFIKQLQCNYPKGLNFYPIIK